MTDRFVSPEPVPAQEIFEHVIKALAQQGAPACTPDGAYRYLDPATGRRCAIGHLLPPGHPIELMSGTIWDEDILYVAPKWWQDRLAFLSDLQSFHDCGRWTEEDFKENAIDLAKVHGLDVQFIDQLAFTRVSA